MNKHLLVGTMALAVTVTMIGCADPTIDEELEGETSAAVIDPEKERAPICGSAVANPQCSAETFVEQALRLSRKDPVGAAISLVKSIKTAGVCIGGIVGTGAAVISGNAVGTVVAGLVAEALDTIDSCKETLQNLASMNLVESVNCFFAPKVLPEKVQLCECTRQCVNVGTHYAPDGYREERTKFKYGRLDQMANCHCTNDKKAVTCKLDCAEWSSKDPKSCGCKRPYL